MAAPAVRDDHLGDFYKRVDRYAAAKGVEAKAALEFFEEHGATSALRRVRRFRRRLDKWETGEVLYVGFFDFDEMCVHCGLLALTLDPDAWSDRARRPQTRRLGR